MTSGKGDLQRYKYINNKISRREYYGVQIGKDLDENNRERVRKKKEIVLNVKKRGKVQNN